MLKADLALTCMETISDSLKMGISESNEHLRDSEVVHATILKSATFGKAEEGKKLTSKGVPQNVKATIS